MPDEVSFWCEFEPGNVASKVDENDYLKWAIAKFNNNHSDELRDAILNTKQVIQAYDTKFVDAEYKLVLDVVEQISTDL